MVKNKIKWYQKAKTYRYIVQGVVFLFILQLLFKIFPTQDITVTAEAYCPFGGFASLYEFLSTNGEKTLTHITASNLIIFGIVVLVTLLLRSGVCGWICPFGTLQDLIRGFGKKVGSLSIMKPLNKKYRRLVKNNKGILTQIDHYGRYFKYFVLIWAITTAAINSHLDYRDYDPMAAIFKLLEFEVTTGAYIMGIILILALFVDRPWCKYACPLGATVGLIGKLSPTRVFRNEELCTNCQLCNKNCPMNIDVASEIYVKSKECNHCLECIDACPTKGALELRTILPGKFQKQPQTIDSIE